MMMMMNENKSFSDFAETWLKESSGRITKSIITVKRENFHMGLKIDFEVENLGFLGFFSLWSTNFEKNST